jgi:YbgC/YbaW family acyl-CoA thioester hydrolase
MLKLNTHIYETEMQVRPDDIDMFKHVHSSRYMDYVLAARYDQMARCYHNPMDSYLEKGLGWVITHCEMTFKRPLILSDALVVQTQLIDATEKSVRVNFFIRKKANNKICCEGYFDYAMIDIQSGKSLPIPEWAMQKYMLCE